MTSSAESLRTNHNSPFSKSSIDYVTASRTPPNHVSSRAERISRKLSTVGCAEALFQKNESSIFPGVYNQGGMHGQPLLEGCLSRTGHSIRNRTKVFAADAAALKTNDRRNRVNCNWEALTQWGKKITSERHWKVRQIISI